MRLLVLSDLHLEVWRDHVPRIDVSISRPDVVILAGDIHTKSRAPSWAAEIFSGLPVVYVAGNHEFYGKRLRKQESQSPQNASVTLMYTFLIVENTFMKAFVF